MKVVEREKIIPAQPERVVTQTVYVASDGREFYFESDCEQYERDLEIKKHPVFASCITGVRTFGDDYGATLYYLGSQEDYDFWFKHAGAYYLNVNQWNDGCGNGWYLFYSVDGGDYADSHYLYKLDEYYRGIRHELKEWYDDIHRKLPYERKGG